MRLNEMLRLIAGSFVIISIALAYYHSQWWLLFTLFVGVNLVQSAFTRWCPMISFLRRLGVKE